MALMLTLALCPSHNKRIDVPLRARKLRAVLSPSAHFALSHFLRVGCKKSANPSGPQNVVYAYRYTQARSKLLYLRIPASLIALKNALTYIDIYSKCIYNIRHN